MFSEIWQWMFGNTKQDAADEAWEAYTRKREMLLRDGFTPWLNQRPPRNARIECVNDISDQNFEAVASQLSPQFNIANVWWREARPMQTIDGHPKQYLH